MRAQRGWGLVYGLCALALITVLAWVSIEVLDLEEQQRTARAEARHQESLRLALWRLDAELIPALAREAARPYFEYMAYYPQGRAYTRMLNTLDPGEVLVPSPLLTYRSIWFPLHFQLSPRTGLTSPQVPLGQQADLALLTCLPDTEMHRNADVLERVRRAAGFDTLWAQVMAAERATPPAAPPTPPPLPQTVVTLPGEGKGEGGGVDDMAEVAVGTEGAVESAAGSGRQALEEAREEAGRLAPAYQPPAEPAPTQAEWSAAEFGKRNRSKLNVQNVADESLRNTFGADTVAEAPVTVGPLVAVWTGVAVSPAELLLLRRVVANDEQVLQGMLVDWPALQTALLAEIHDLLPDAELRPTDPGDVTPEEAARTLAMIPAVLETGPTLVEDAGWSATRGTLLLAWAAVLVALGAVGLTLRSTVAFAEKRSRFASAVTHELRTPLTTFRMYAEMLADDMVTSPEHRDRYLQTLRSEADRLGRLVENVLAYARVEDGRASLQPRDVCVADLVARIAPALRARAAESGLELQIVLGQLGEELVHTDEEAVGQILANLVDNAGKYAADGEPATLRLEAAREDGRVQLSLCDHGPGVPVDMAATIFSAFDRGAIQPGDTRPGLGLGLALSRGLARDLGGDLVLEALPPDHAPGAPGARFTLLLPRRA